jgi:hypothetical protein
MKRLARERSKLFDQEADCYDRSRPTYPDALMHDLVGSRAEGLDVLDVGCGTGIASGWSLNVAGTRGGRIRAMGDTAISPSSSSHRKSCWSGRYRFAAVDAEWRSRRTATYDSTMSGVTSAAVPVLPVASR